MPTILRGSDNFDTGTDFYADSDALTLFNAGGSAPVYACRAWVNFNGAGTVTIGGSGNVSSITDNGTGDYTVNFTNTFSNANYSYAMSFQHDGNPNVAKPKSGEITTSSIGVNVGQYQAGSTNSNVDPITASVAIFGDQ